MPTSTRLRDGMSRRAGGRASGSAAKGRSRSTRSSSSRSTASGGFFTRGRGAGRAGRDFVTSPEVGPLFGALVAARARRLVARAGASPIRSSWSRPAPAGVGSPPTSSPPRPTCARALRYVLVERSASAARRRSASCSRSSRSRTRSARRSRRRRRRSREPGGRAAGPIVTALDELPAVPLDGVVLANELLDNLPFRIVERAATTAGSRCGSPLDGDRSRRGARPGRPSSSRPRPTLVADGATVPRRRPRSRCRPRPRVAASACACGAPARRARGRRLRRHRGAELVARGRSRLVAHLPRARAGRRRRSTRPASRTSPSTSRSSTSCTLARRGRASELARRRSRRPSGCASLGVDELVAEARRDVGRACRTSATSRRSRHRSRVTEAAALTDPAGLGAHRVLVFTDQDDRVRERPLRSRRVDRRRATAGDRGDWPTEPQMSDTIESLLAEGRTFPPPADVHRSTRSSRDAAVVRRGRRRPRGVLGASRPASSLDWFEPWHTVLEWDLPFAKWFVGGKLNVSYNCLDRHVDAGHGDQVAYHWEGEPGDTRTITYAELLDDVRRARQRAEGARRRRRATGSTSTWAWCPSCPMALLACARIGAAHSVVFGGFSSDSLRDRINDAEAKVLITGDGAWRRGSIVPLKETADVAVAECPTIEKVLVLRRTEQDVAMTDGRDVWWHDLVPQQSVECAPEPMDAEDLLYLLYTSGTTAQAQGHHAHDRRLPHPGRVDAQARVRPAPRHRRLLVRGRRRLGHRPLVHRLRAAREPRDERALRGHARPPRQGPALADRREVRRHDPLHRAHRDPHLHEVGPRVPGGPRPLVAAAARQRRRADQPRGVGLVLAAHRRRALPGRRHVVADRDRRHHDQPAARRHHAEARERDVPAPGDRRRHRRRRRRVGRRSPAAATSCSPARGRRCCAASGATRALPRHLLEPVRRPVLRGRRRQARRRRLLLAARPGRRRHARLRPQHLDRRGRARARRAPRGRRGRGRRHATTRPPARRSARS